MSPIPAAELPGHKALRERAVAALDALRELQSLDFKSAAPWDALKLTIIRTALAMANLRDGGLIIIGVSESGGSWERTGLESAQLGTYDYDTIIDQINSFASPHIDATVVTVRYRDEKEFLVIAVEEFDESPIVCKKYSPDEPNGRSRAMSKGDVFIRPPGKPQTTRIMDSTQMHDLLELAAEKKARKLLAVANRVGFVPSVSVSERFDKELDGI